MIEIRTAKKEDAERLLEIYDYYVRNTAVSFEYETPSLDEFTRRMEHTLSQYPYLVIVRILSEALETELKKMGILNVYGCIAYPIKPDEYLTTNSADYHEHLGFRTAGIFHKCAYKFGRWYNMIWMEKTIGEHTDQPVAVRRYQNQRDNNS